MADTFDATMDELTRVQQDVIDALVRARTLAAKVKPHLPEVTEFVGTPTEVILQQMLVTNEAKSVEDRKQVAMLVALVDRLQTSIDDMSAADLVVAENLAAARGRADATDGEAGAAADAGLKSGME